MSLAEGKVKKTMTEISSKNDMNIKPLSTNIILEEIDKEEKEGKTDSGIIIPDVVDDSEAVSRAKVVAIGSKVNSVKVNDTVLFEQDFLPKQIKQDGKEYIIIEESKIYGLLD